MSDKTKPSDEDDWTVEESRAYRMWMFTGPDGDPGEPEEIQERAWIGGFRAGVATHNTVSREQLIEAFERDGLGYGLDHWDAEKRSQGIALRNQAANVVLALLVPTSKETSE